MLLRSCLACEFHEILHDQGERKSHCRKENCWARYSKCVMLKALEQFLEDERASERRPFSAISHVYTDQ